MQGVIEELQKRIRERRISVGVIGLGYVGLPLVARFLECGFKVLGFDTDAKKVLSLNEGCSYIKDVPSSILVNALKKEQFFATCDVKNFPTQMLSLSVCPHLWEDMMSQT
jgi:UDP-N-acetyl-D-glucosamine dehydrogenase